MKAGAGIFGSATATDAAGNISAAMPKGLSLGDLGSLLPANSGSASRGPSHEPAPAGLPGWLLPLLAVAALGVAAYLWTRPKPEGAVIVSETKDGPITDRVTEVIEVEGNRIIDTVQEVITIDPKFLEAVKAGTTATELFSGLTKTLTGVTNEATAKAALPELEKFAPLLKTLESEAGKLAAEEKPSLTAFLGKNLGLLQKVIDTVMAIPGVKDVLGAVVTPMVETLTKLAK